MALTKLDVLSYMDQIPVCAHYDAATAQQHRRIPLPGRCWTDAKPVIEYMPGWKCDISGVRDVGRAAQAKPGTMLTYVEQAHRLPHHLCLRRRGTGQPSFFDKHRETARHDQGTQHTTSRPAGVPLRLRRYMLELFSAGHPVPDLAQALGGAGQGRAWSWACPSHRPQVDELAAQHHRFHRL